MPSPDEVRATLVALAEDRGDSLSSLSRLTRLDEADRLVLAKHFRVDERRLGAREPWTPAAIA